MKIIKNTENNNDPKKVSDKDAEDAFKSFKSFSGILAFTIEGPNVLINFASIFKF